jgi:DNA-directed RNA polymerase subunit E'/Rpb7
MDNPYFNTYLYSNVSLHPSQMCNGIMSNLKDNLIKKLQNKCYKSFGFISKIYNIKITKNGIIVPEDTSSSALFEVKFSCKLCKPILSMEIVCEIVNIIKHTIYLKNGPIEAVVCVKSETEALNINLDNFILKNNDVLEKINKHNAKLLRPGKHVVIKITKIQYKDKMPHIRVEGFLERVATESETNEMIKIGEETDMDYVKYTDYENKYKKIVEYDDRIESEISSSDESDVIQSSGTDETNDEITSDDED